MKQIAQITRSNQLYTLYCMSTSYLICITDPTYEGYTDFCQQRFLEKYKAKSKLRAHKNEFVKTQYGHIF